MRSLEINFDFKSLIYNVWENKKKIRHELNTKYKKNISIIYNHNFLWNKILKFLSRKNL